MCIPWDQVTYRKRTMRENEELVRRATGVYNLGNLRGMRPEHVKGDEWALIARGRPTRLTKDGLFFIA